MENSLKNIKNLSTLFIKDNEYNFDLFKNNKLNKKSTWYGLIVILFFGLAYISYESMDYLKSIGKPQIFLNFYFLFLNILIIIKSTINIFFYSKDLEYVLPMPFKPIEILLSKFNTLLYYLYSTLILFAVVPFCVYGIYMKCSILFFIKLIILLIIFPIIPALIVSGFTIILVKIFKFIKNKNVIQFLITGLLMIILFFGLYYIIKSTGLDIENIIQINETNIDIKDINKYFFNINLIINILENNKFLNIIFDFIYLIAITLISFIVYIFIGKKIYLNQLLKMSAYLKNKKIKEVNIKRKFKKRKIYKTYIKKEFKIIFKNPIYFIQCIYPIIITTILALVFIIAFIPVIKEVGIKNNLFDGIKLDMDATVLILGVLQFIGLLNKTSVTSISREGKDLYIMKYLPVDFYKQFIYKNMPQILVNTFISIIILITLFLKIEVLKIEYIIMVFIISFLMFCINSYILSIVNLLMPKNEWETEYEIFKNNKNILIQYVLIFGNIFCLYYIDKALYDYNLNKCIFGIIVILGIIFIFLNILINKYKNKLFNKIK